MHISKQELYNRYDLIINSIMRNMYYESRKTSNKIVLDFRNKYKGKKLYFEIAKMIQNLENSKVIVIDSNYLTYLKIKLKNRKLKIERNKDKLKTYDHISMTNSILEGWMLGNNVLEDIYEAYYKKGAVIEQ